MDFLVVQNIVSGKQTKFKKTLFSEKYKQDLQHTFLILLCDKKQKRYDVLKLPWGGKSNGKSLKYTAQFEKAVLKNGQFTALLFFYSL